MKIDKKRLEIFCGTGGVGKTTLATSRGMYLARNPENNVLVMTVDPSKRLKQVLGLDDKKSGEVEKIQSENDNISALLINPMSTLEREFKSAGISKHGTNHILKILARPYGGLNEILGLLELYEQMQNPSFTHIILDTPPGQNFVDFLESGKKIESFFDKQFIEIFNFIEHKNTGKRGLLKKIIDSGIDKLLKYLESVTGPDFVQEFISAVDLIFQLKDKFNNASALPDRIKKEQLANWFLVSSTEQAKFEEVLGLKKDFDRFGSSENSYFLINKCIKDQINLWEPQSSLAIELKNSLISKENEICLKAEKYFSKILKFNELSTPSPLEQVKELSEQWNIQ